LLGPFTLEALGLAFDHALKRELRELPMLLA
jgi:hypothetical protein